MLRFLLPLLRGGGALGPGCWLQRRIQLWLTLALLCHRGAGDDGNVLVALSKETKSFPLTLSKGLKGRCFSLAFSLGS